MHYTLYFRVKVRYNPKYFSWASGEMVYTRDLKSLDESRAGSSPAWPTVSSWRENIKKIIIKIKIFVMSESGLVPNHVAIIMDGNRRWATKRGLPKIIGHTEGAKAMKRIIAQAIKRNISYLTFWALSTENIHERSEGELSHLFGLFKRLVEYLGDLTKEGVRVLVIGDMSGLPQDVQGALTTVVEETRGGNAMTMILAVNYGGRDELVRAVHKMCAIGTPLEQLDEAMFGSLLDTSGVPDPDLIIRTGGKHRLSGFLPWQSVYAELYFTDTFWPDFDEASFDAALTWYGAVERNFGK
jgi:undecaprenyl diphosphate synthase